MMRSEMEHAEIEITMSRYIPLVMNALYNKEASSNITLETIRDAFRSKQMASKQWLSNAIILSQLSKDSKILVVGGWIGFISMMLFKMGYENVNEIDLDTSMAEFTKHLNRFNSKFKHITGDVNDHSTEEYDAIINCSCEHILDNSWFDRINKSIVFLQSTNLQSWDHTNTVQSVDEMVEKYPCKLDYKGTLKCGDWSRFMIVGYK